MKVGITAWMFWTRHYRGLSLIALWLVCLGLGAMLLPGSTARVVAAVFIPIPFTLAFFYLVGVFSYALETDLGSPQSGFPSHMLTLPVPTVTLVQWPLLFGTAYMLLSWAFLSLFIFPRLEVISVGWAPALLGAAVLAWCQAIIWTPFSIPAVRVSLLLLALMMLFAAQIVVVTWKPWPLVLNGSLIVLILAAYLMAYRGVCRARHNGTTITDWSFAVLLGKEGSEKPFESAVAGQFWLENREHGRRLLLGVAALLVIYLPFFSLFEKIAEQTTTGGLLPAIEGISAQSSATVRCLALYLAIFLLCGIGVGLSYGFPESRQQSHLSGSGLLTLLRPLSTWTLVRIKLRLVLQSVLKVSLLLAVVLPLWLQLTGRMAALMDLRLYVLSGCSDWQVVALIILAFVLFAGLLGAQQLGGLWIALSGRSWVRYILLAVTLTIAFGLTLVTLLLASQEKPTFPLWWTVLLWTFWVALVVKLAVAAWATKALLKRNLVPGSVLSTFWASWFLLTLLIPLLLKLLLPMPLPWGGLLLGAALLMPLCSLLLAPITLAWNRHR